MISSFISSITPELCDIEWVCLLFKCDVAGLCRQESRRSSVQGSIAHSWFLGAGTVKGLSCFELFYQNLWYKPALQNLVTAASAIGWFASITPPPQLLCVLGNEVINGIYERKPADGLQKPSADSPRYDTGSVCFSRVCCYMLSALNV